MISVITPVYNGEAYIKETIDSVLEAARDFNVEYLVIDDGSIDKTVEIVNLYKDQVVLLEKENGGESSAVNLGLANASGELILVVSADDPIPSSAIFRGAEKYFQDNPEVVAWYPNWNIIDSDGCVVREVEVEEYSDKSLIGRFKCLPGPGTLFRRDAAVQIGGRNLKWRFVGDYDFWLRLSKFGKLTKRHENVAQWRFHPESTSISKRGYEMAIERIQVIEDFINHQTIGADLEREALAHAYYFASRLSFFDPKVPGKRYLWKALRANGGRIHEGKILVYVFIFLLPFSRFLVHLLKPLLRRFGKALT